MFVFWFCFIWFGLVLPVDVQLFQHHLLRSLLFLYWIVLAHLSEISWLYLCGLFLGSLFHWSICLFLCQYHTVLIQFSSVQSLSHVQLFASPWTAARQASLSITNSQSLLKLMSIEPVMPSNHLILCRPLCLPPSIFPSISIFSNESVLCIRWPKYWSFSFSISPSNEYSGLISFRIDWCDLLAVQGTLKSLLQHHSSKASLRRLIIVALYCLEVR